jgi:hypothetical protein
MKSTAFRKAKKLAHLSQKISQNFDTCISCQIRGGEEKEEIENQEFKRRENLRIWAKMPLKAGSHAGKKVSSGPK